MRRNDRGDPPTYITRSLNTQLLSGDSLNDVITALAALITCGCSY